MDKKKSLLAVGWQKFIVNIRAWINGLVNAGQWVAEGSNAPQGERPSDFFSGIFMQKLDSDSETN